MEKPENSVVVITRAEQIDYSRDFVALPGEYGTPAYDARADVSAIQAALRENLLTLDSETGFTGRLRGRRVILKPNLVTVFHNLGTRQPDYPQSTDPRLIDALVVFLQQYTRDIVIAESSGRGMPTRASFHISGLDRLARVRGVELAALEEQPVERYLLPKARVMREVVVPRLFSQVIRGEAFYISMPKMKTNLYAGVTLGFKNAMGVLTYNLRQRNHNYALDQKLVDMLYLLRADLVIIDGLIGGEGNCPAPVQPVCSGVIVSGNHSVETDRAAVRLMGIDPAQVRLMRLADENGFADPQAKIIGEARVTPFQQADASLFGGWMQENFPNVRVLIGHHLAGTPQPDGQRGYLQDGLCALEQICRGGCLAATRYGFDMLYHEGTRRDFHLTLVIGGGVLLDGEAVYYDREGQRYTRAQIASLPGKKAAIGTCAAGLRGAVNRFIPGCMPFPNAAHMLIHHLSGTTCAVMGPRNRYLLRALLETLRTHQRRKALLQAGEHIDVPLGFEDLIDQARVFTPQESTQDWVYEPFEPLTREEIRALCAQEDRSMLATFRP